MFISTSSNTFPSQIYSSKSFYYHKCFIPSSVRLQCNWNYRVCNNNVMLLQFNGWRKVRFFNLYHDVNIFNNSDVKQDNTIHTSISVLNLKVLHCMYSCDTKIQIKILRILKMCNLVFFMHLCRFSHHTCPNITHVGICNIKFSIIEPSCFKVNISCSWFILYVIR